MVMKRFGTSCLSLLFILSLSAQEIKIPATISSLHPRLLTNAGEKPGLQQLIGSADWAHNTLEQSKKDLETRPTAAGSFRGYRCTGKAGRPMCLSKAVFMTMQKDRRLYQPCVLPEHAMPLRLTERQNWKI
jgi:hypothetical protein